MNTVIGRKDEVRIVPILYIHVNTQQKQLNKRSSHHKKSEFTLDLYEKGEEINNKMLHMFSQGITQVLPFFTILTLMVMVKQSERVHPEN